MASSLPFNELGAVPGGSYLDDGEERKVRRLPLEMVESHELGAGQTITTRASAVCTYVPCERPLAAGQTVRHETIHQGMGGRERHCKYTSQWPLHFPLIQGCSLAALVLEK